MSSTLHELAHEERFGTVQSDGCIVVNHRLPGRFTVHGMSDPNRQTPTLSYTVALYYPDGWQLKETLYAGARQFIAPLHGRIEHGPGDSAPYSFSVVIPVTELHADPRQQFGWLGQCLFNALLTAVEQTTHTLASS